MAIFILVIMALLGTAMVTLTQTSQQTTATAVLSTRAFYAAESGLQYGLSQVFTLDGSAATCSNPFPAVNFDAKGLAGCTATVACTSNTVGSKTYYTLNSTGRCQLSDASATRQLELKAAEP
jgi:MSHA biogenesis protein MshP